MNKIFRFVFFLIAALALTGCVSHIDEDAYVMKKNYDNTYDLDPKYGTLWKNPFASYYELHGRQRMLELNNFKPKDKDQIQLRSIRLTVFFSVGHEESILFYRHTNDITCPESLNNCIVGETYLTNLIDHTFNKTMQKFSAETLASDIATVETQFLADLRAAIATNFSEWGGNKLFDVSEIRIAEPMFSEITENKIQAIAIINAEEAKAEANMRVMEKRKEALVAYNKMISESARESNMTVNQVIEAMRVQAISEMNSSPTVTVNAESQLK